MMPYNFSQIQTFSRKNAITPFDVFNKDFHSALEGNPKNIHEENKNKNN